MQTNTNPTRVNTSTGNTDDWAVDEHEAAIRIGMSVFFLRKDRRTKRLIPFYRIGDRILYNPRRVFEALAALEEGGKRLKSSAKKVTI
jgi:hypothetical protein